MILIGIDDLDPISQVCQIWSQNWNVFQYVIWHLKQIEHTHYEYSAWNWGTWPKIIDSDKFQPNTEYCSDFYEFWYSQQIGHAYYEYNICQCLEH